MPGRAEQVQGLQKGIRHAWFGLSPGQHKVERVRNPRKGTDDLGVSHARHLPWRWKTVISALCCRNHRDPNRVARIRTDSALFAGSRRQGGSTPVPMVAMDCGLLESRLDRLSASDRQGRGQRLESGGSSPTDRLSERTYGADVYRSEARKEVFRKNRGSRGDAEPH
jgi:hypothetical protein